MGLRVGCGGFGRVGLKRNDRVGFERCRWASVFRFGDFSKEEKF